MRSFSFVHAVGLCALWCVAVLFYVGRSFIVYDVAVTGLNETRAKTALGELRAYLQFETDKGDDLIRLGGVQDKLARFVKNDKDVDSVFVFDAGAGKVIFSSRSAQVGLTVPDEWRKKCDGQRNFFVEDSQNGSLFDEQRKNQRVIGTPVYNAFSEKTACVAAEYRNAGLIAVRNRMAETAFSTTLKLLLIGLGCLLLLTALIRFPDKLPLKKRERNIITAAVLTASLAMIPLTVGKMKASFENDMKPVISGKSKIILNLLRDPTEKAVAGGVPLTDISGAEAFFEQVRKNNPEILFVLLTDKSGRVLFQAGSAAEAFTADKLTGKVSLRDGYFSDARPVRLNDDAVGWIQIGINERFVRENLF